MTDGSADWVVATDRERAVVAVMERLARVNAELDAVRSVLFDMKESHQARRLNDAQQIIAVVKMRLRESINE